MSFADRIREHVRENPGDMIDDLTFAVAWVLLVSALFEFVFVAAPRWAYYLFMLAGIPAYFGFFWSLEMAKQKQDE